MDGTHSIANTGFEKPTKAQNEEQLRRIIHSEGFRHATALQRLLQYLGSKATEDPLGEIKEYTIGMEVFERGPDYDPKIDTIVRVQIHRLRLKLKEFYETEGSKDQVFVDLPKGHYLPSFEFRNATAAGKPRAGSEREPSAEVTSQPAGSTQVTPSLGNEKHDQHERSTRIWPRRAVLVSAAVLLFASGLFVGTHWGKPAISGVGDNFPLLGGTLANASEDPARNFWASFLGNDRSPVVGYADAVFLADQSSDLFRFRRGASDDRGTTVEPHLAKQFASNPGLVEKAGPLYYEDGYTGTGDVEGIYTLTRLFTQMGLQLTVKRCRLVTIDDLRDHNVILLGSADQNNAVEQLPQNADFVFQPGNPPGAWGARFLNRQPRPGESESYKAERDPATHELKANYDLITIQPGAITGRYIAILSALDTSGVAADAEFMSSPTQMAELLQRLQSMGEKIGSGQLPTFQALLRVDVEKGDDVLDVKLLTVHVIHPNPDAPASPSASPPPTL